MAHPTFNTSDPDVFLNGIEALIFDTVERVDLVEEILSLAGFQTPELLNSVAFKEEYSVSGHDYSNLIPVAQHSLLRSLQYSYNEQERKLAEHAFSFAVSSSFLHLSAC
jgi:hypothetical protein